MELYDDDDERVLPSKKLPELFKLVDENKQNFIDVLKEAVSIKSVSNNPEYSDDILKMLKFCKEKLENLGASVDLIDGNDEKTTNLPPVLFANLFVDFEYKTICVYGNIDVLLPKKGESINYSSFELKDENGRLYGCGISDNKAPLFCWLNALNIYKISKNEIPVNVKFIIEGTSECYSQSLNNAIYRNSKFFGDIEYICLTIDKKASEKPCLKYSYRGICQCTFFTTCGERKVHSGTFGGAFNQPHLDALQIVGSFKDKHGKIVISNFLKDVKPVTKMDTEYIEKQLNSVESLKKKIGVKCLEHNDKPSRIIMHKAFLPSLTVNSFQLIPKADKEDYASIPNKVLVNFLVRLVVNQTHEKSFRQIENHVEKKWNLMGSTNTYDLKMNFGFDPWQEDPSSDHYKAAHAAIKTVYNVSPDYFCEGYTIPVVSIFKRNCPASNILVMPISDNNGHEHTINESISIETYIKGIKLAMAYLCEVHEIY